MKKIIEKTCRICGQTKPLKDFVIHHNYKDGHSNLCRMCNRDKYHRSFRSQVLESLGRIEERFNKYFP